MGFIGKQPSKAAITSSDITDGVVTADKLASDSVTTAKIADNGVTTAKINADAITDAKIADDVVGSEHLTAGEVDTTALGADAVTAAKIADDAISDEHLDPTAITGQTAETSAADDDLILLSDTSASAALKKMTRSNFLSGVGGTNTPAFHAYNNANQTISNDTETQLIFNTEIYDTDNAFASNTFTVPSGKGGKYFVYFRLAWSSGNDFSFQVTLKINDSFNADSGFRVNQLNDYYDSVFSGQVVNLSAGDTLKLYIYTGENGQNISGSENRANFGAYKIIE